MVVVKDDALDFALAPLPAPMAAIPASRAGAPEGGVYETSPAATALIGEIARIIATRGGGALILDYGYDEPGFGETLQAVRGHEYAPLLRAPGSQDLSAHVDFTALGDAARQGGAAICGPNPQGDFLNALGISCPGRCADQSQSC